MGIFFEISTMGAAETTCMLGKSGHQFASMVGVHVVIVT
ncbi:hypothetical protein AF72_00470 [Xylella taiwanensis]|uniref:Uncharacterized protein n=1 Tax=Xylella taiwanensis TaxID=1444770 RepID=Z9JN60_9GAMM|nr:hypothetical protein AF72_00470 [Xylella taiwanensis]